MQQINNYHSDPSESGNTFADGAQVVKQRRCAILLSVGLDSLNRLRSRRQKFHQVSFGGCFGARRHDQKLTLSPNVIKISSVSYQ